MKRLETLYIVILCMKPDDEEGGKFWKKVIYRMKEAAGVNGMTIYSFVSFDIMKKMYENLTDKKHIIIVERISTVTENSTQ